MSAFTSIYHKSDNLCSTQLHCQQYLHRGGDIGGPGGAQALPLFRLGGSAPPIFPGIGLHQATGLNYTGLHCQQFGPRLSRNSVQQSHPDPTRLNVWFALMQSNYEQPWAPPPQLNIQNMSPPLLGTCNCLRLCYRQFKSPQGLFSHGKQSLSSH